MESSVNVILKKNGDSKPEMIADGSARACDLVYTMATIFGFIFGIWKGRNSDDWNNKRVLIERSRKI